VIPDGGGVIVRDIPLEPTDFDWNEEQKYAHDLYQFFSRVDRPLAYLSFALVPTGFLTSLWSVIVSPVPINIAFVAAYFLLGLLFMGGLGPRLYGFVKTRVGTPLPFARLEAHRPGSPVIAGCAIADHFGRYYLLLPKGDFVLTIVLSRGEPGDATIVDEREIHTRGYYSRDVVIKDQST
jgi:hypothetical protein